MRISDGSSDVCSSDLVTKSGGLDGASAAERSQSSLKLLLQRKSTVAFLLTLPLILIIGSLVIYPAFYAVHLATLNKSMERFVGFGNFTFLFKREVFWMVVQQSCIFEIGRASCRERVCKYV